MKKKLLVALLTLGTIVSLTGCNQQVVDLTYHYDRAIIGLPNGEIIDGKVQSWKDYEGEQLQIKINGKTYLTHAENVVLISE